MEPHRNGGDVRLYHTEGAPREARMGRWDPAKKRQNYARLRLQELRKRFPHLPEDILSRVSLRDLNTAVRRAGTNQTVLPESTARSDSSNRAGSSKQKGEQRSDELQQNCLEPPSRASP
jgi:hypothetical protein